MIRSTDSAVLAITKLHTRRIRTSVTVVVSGLLFAGLIAALVVAQGTNSSILSFSKEGLNSRYIVSAAPDPPLTTAILQDPVVHDRAQQIYDQTVAGKRAEAKKLDIPYNSSDEPTPLITPAGVLGQQAKSILNFSSPAAQQALTEYIQAHPGPSLDRLEQIASPYHPSGFYGTTQGGYGQGLLTTMQGGVENFNPDPQGGGNQQHDILQNGIEKVDPQLANPFLLHNLPKQPDANAVPVIVTYSAAEQLLGLHSLPKSAQPAEQLARIQELYAKAGSVTFSACYRNNVSSQQISTAISQAAEIAKNQGNKDYQAPHLIYGLPAADSCGAATILKDTRTASEKTLDTKQDTFNAMFGQVIDPIQQKLTFRIVGLTPNQNGGSSTTIGGILQKIVGSSLGGQVAIPSDLLAKLPDAAAVQSVLFPSQTNVFGFSPTSYFVEFANGSDARNFIDNTSCTTRPDGRCATATRPFQLNAYGSNSIALQDLQHKFVHFFELAALAVIAIAIVIMSGTVGRMIADSRRETAVFRAIGAKRIDIARIYSIYTLCLSVYVALFALLAGMAAAYGFDKHFWQTSTVQAQLLFGASDTSRHFHFFSVNTVYVGAVLLVVIVCGFVSMLLPLLRNLRRSPIKDMREE